MSEVKRIVGDRPMTIPMRWCTLESKAAASAFKPCAGDVFISTFMKTGTTWLQQICHQLRTGGDTDFEEICEVVPWLECMHMVHQGPRMSQKALPRLFKTHQRLSALPDPEGTTRFLCTIRDPEKTLLSMFKFLHSKGHPNTKDDDVNAFAQTAEFRTSGPRGMMFEYYEEYWQCCHLPNVLLVCFEDLQEDLDSHVRLISHFLGVPATEALVESVCHLASYQWMLENSNKFDDHWMFSELGVEEHATSKVGFKGSSVANCELTPETKSLLQQLWRENVTPTTGLEAYSDMRASIQLRRLK